MLPVAWRERPFNVGKLDWTLAWHQRVDSSRLELEKIGSRFNLEKTRLGGNDHLSNIHFFKHKIESGKLSSTVKP